MSKGLEELRRAKYYIGQVMIRDKEIANNKLLNCLCDFEKSYITIEKELKTLEIVKKYHVTPALFDFYETYQCYVENMKLFGDENEEILSEEEYNLAKEILNA